MINKLFKKAILILGLAFLVTSIPITTQAKTKELSKSIKTGDTVYFGKYEQDGNTKNGKEKIEWLVLEKKGGKALLISKKVLNVQPYNKENKDITWEKCTLRKWLNKDFMKEAFTSKENKKVQNSKIENKDNIKKGEYGWYIKGGKNTTDKVFLLSIDEAKKYFKKNEKRKAKITNYGIKRMADLRDHLTETDVRRLYFSKSNNWYSWLRSPAAEQNDAAIIGDDGVVYEGGFGAGEGVDNDYLGVRPALWVNL